MAYSNNKQRVPNGTYIPTPIPSSPSYNPPPSPSQEEGSVPSIPIPTFDGNCVLKLYKSYDEHQVMNKRLSDEIVIPIVIKDRTDIINPSFVIEYDLDISDYNYCYLDITDRYYYCTVTLIENGFFLFDCEVDVLMSHKNGIKSLTAIIDKTELSSYSNMDLPNEELLMQYGIETEIKRFPYSLKENNFRNVLVVVGKTETIEAIS